MRAFVIAGSPTGRRPLAVAPQSGDFVVAADLGAQHALDWGWRLDLLVGDLDSLAVETSAMLRRRGVPTLQVPAAKDQTDTELALLAALEHGADEIVIAAGLGGRTDHLLANVSLLARAALHGCVVSLADGGETVRLAQTEAGPVVTVIPGAPGDLVSLLPYGADAEGITTEALLYPLYAETLRLGEARGVSNVMVSERAEVSLMRGRLLVIHYRMESE